MASTRVTSAAGSLLMTGRGAARRRVRASARRSRAAGHGDVTFVVTSHCVSRRVEARSAPKAVQSAAVRAHREVRTGCGAWSRSRSACVVAVTLVRWRGVRRQQCQAVAQLSLKAVCRFGQCLPQTQAAHVWKR